MGKRPDSVHPDRFTPSISRRWRQACPLALLALCGGQATAFELQLGPVSGYLNNTASFGLAWRLDDRKGESIGIANGGNAASVNYDDGDLNYNNNRVPVSRAWKLVSELSLGWDNYEMYVSGRLLYDSRNDDPNLHPGSDVRDEVGRAADLFDAWIGGSWEVAGRNLTLRAGQQVLKWGESNLTLHGLNELTPVNAARIRVPGASLDEGRESVPMVWGSLDLTDTVAVEAFWQWKWERTEPDPRGTFYSTNDFAVLGGRFAMLGFGVIDEPTTFGVFDGEPGDAAAVPRAPDRNPSNSGQYGVAARWVAEALNSTEFGFYFAQYHSRRPLFSGISSTGSPTSARYFSEYPEDIQMFGVTFNADEPYTGLAIQGEFTHRRGLPLQVDDIELFLLGLGLPTSQAGNPQGPGTYIKGYRRFNYTQYAFSFTKVVGPGNFLAADQITLLLEASGGHVHNFPSQDELRFSAPGTFCRGGNVPESAFPAPITGYCLNNQGFGTASAWGLKFAMTWAYPQIIRGVNMKPRFAYFWDVNGTSPDPLVLYAEGSRRMLLGSEFAIGQSWIFDIVYDAYFGGGQYNARRDRDAIAIAVKYAF